MAGVQAAELIRSLSLTSQPKIVALIANTSDEQREQCFKAGMNSWLAKPVWRDSSRKAPSGTLAQLG